MNPVPSEERHVVDAVVHHPRLQDLPRSLRERTRMNRFAKDLARWLVGRPREELGALARVVTVVARRELRDARRLCQERPLLAVEAAARTVEALWPLLRGPELPDPPESEPPPPPGEGEDGDGEGEGGGGAGGAASESDDDGEEDEEEGMSVPGGGAGGAGAGDDEDAEEDGEDAEEDGEGAEDEAEGEETDGEGEETDSEDGDDGDDGDDGPEAEEAEDSPEEDGLDPLDVLESLAELGPIADPELDALAERLREAMGGDEGDGDGGQETVDIASAAADLLAEAGVGQAAAEGALQTDRVARHLERFLPGVGWSAAPGALEHTLLNQLDGLVTLLEKLDDLKELADALGRMEEPTRERGVLQGGREEVVGVHLSGEVNNALPSELALLADPETEDLFYQRYTEHRLISLELTGEGDQGASAGDKRGPVIACIDTSGSMQGAPELAAKALVLAVCRRVLPRNRAVHLILFGGQGERTELRLKRGRGGLESLLAFLRASFHSGTDFDGPLLRAMDLLEERDLLRADVLVVTDGLCRASRAVIERVVDVRDATGARVWSVVLGRSDTRGVEPFSHEVLTLDPDAAAQASGLLRGLENGTRTRWTRSPDAR